MTITRTATNEFSNPRLVLAHFSEAESLLRSILRDLVESKFGISKRLVFAIQQMERTEGGLSSVEKRALVDMCEHSGGIRVKVFDASENVTHLRAIAELSKAE